MNDQSWSFVTAHKAASTYVHQLLIELFAEGGFNTRDILSKCFELGLDERLYLESLMPLQVKPHYFYSPFRTETADLIVHVKELRPIIHVRDPRDCFVSYFYSVAYSHALPDEDSSKRKFLKRRWKMLSLQIDGWAMRHIQRRDYVHVRSIRRAHQRRPDAILSKYEDMVTDFEAWITTLNEQMGRPFSSASIAKRIAETHFSVEENIHNHKRQVTPGDFRRKLNHEAQAALTEVYRQDLEYFGYAL